MVNFLAIILYIIAYFGENVEKIGGKWLIFEFIYDSIICMNRDNKRGKIDISGLTKPPENQEYDVAVYFSKRGLDVVFIRPSNIKGTNSPDFVMGGKNWEIKSPIKQSQRTFDETFSKATSQSANVIYDLRRTRASDEKFFLENLLRKRVSPKIKTLLVITRDGRLLTVKGKFDIMKL